MGKSGTEANQKISGENCFNLNNLPERKKNFPFLSCYDESKEKETFTLRSMWKISKNNFLK